MLVYAVMSIGLSEARMELTLGVSDMLTEKYGINVSDFSYAFDLREGFM